MDLGGAAFHPKLLVAEYDDQIRVVVGSANLTRPGWTSLFELFVVEALERGEPHPWAVSLRTFLESAARAAGGIGAACARVAALPSRVPVASPASLHHSFAGALAQTALPAGAVSRIDVVSPFFEGEEGAGVFDHLRRRCPRRPPGLFLSAAQTKQGYVVHGPPVKLQALRDSGAELRLIRASWDGDDDRAPDRRALHGKLLGFRVGRRHHVLVGSANATRAALLRNVAARGNAELVAQLDLGAAAYERLLPPSFATESQLTFDEVDASGEEDVQQDAARHVNSATYEAATARLTLRLDPDAPALEVRYLDMALGTAHAPVWTTELLALGADAHVTVDAGAGPAIVPFVLLDPEALVPRGTPLDLDLEALAELLAGRRELAHAPGDELGSAPPGTVSGGAGIFGRGAIPWRRIIAGLQGLHDDLVRQQAVPEPSSGRCTTRCGSAVSWTASRPRDRPSGSSTAI